jgi:hypothetical protein
MLFWSTWQTSMPRIPRRSNPYCEKRLTLLFTAAARMINTLEPRLSACNKDVAFAYFPGLFKCQRSREITHEIGTGKSAACGSPLRRAYPPYRRCGRVAEGGGLLNRYRVVKPYRGFESLRLRHPSSFAYRVELQPQEILFRNVNVVGQKCALISLIHRGVGAFEMPRI